MSRINSLTKDGTSYSTPEEISNIFNEHFISIADNIIDNTINTEPYLTSLLDFVNRKKAGNSADFSIPTISEREVLEIIKSLPSNALWQQSVKFQCFQMISKQTIGRWFSFIYSHKARFFNQSVHVIYELYYRNV